MAEPAAQALGMLALECEEEIRKIENASSIMEKALDSLNQKVSYLEAECTRLTSDLEQLQFELSDAEEELQNTDETVSYDDEEGNQVSIPNPEFVANCEVVDEIREKIDDVESELSSVQQRLDQAHELASRIAAQIDVMGSTVYSLGEKKSQLDQFKDKLLSIGRNTRILSSEAENLLSKVIVLIEEYMTTQMNYDSSISFDRASILSVNSLFSVTINIYKSEPKQDDYQAKNKSRIDDNGKVFRIGDELVKNDIFQIDGYSYRTDNSGRTISASGTLKMPEKHDRHMESMDVVGKGEQHENDDMGHLIGHQFFGSDKLENLVPQADAINQGIYRKLEEDLAKQVISDHDVKVNVIPLYEENGRRPVGIFYFYNIDGNSHVVLFPNEVKETQ